MSIEHSLEEELMIEQQIRNVHNHGNSKEVVELCASLIKQNHYQQKLLGQAVKRIMELEVTDECQNNKPRQLS